MLAFKRGVFPEDHYQPGLKRTDQQVVLLLSLLLILAMDFIFTSLVQSYYQTNFYDLTSAGFWILLVNSGLMYGLFLLAKNFVDWDWQQVGFQRPLQWKNFSFSIAALILGLILIKNVQPIVYAWTSQPVVEHFAVFQDNLPMLLGGLIYVWFHGAFLQELIYRSLFINTFNILLGHSKPATIAAVILSSFVFGLIHAWQGWGGVILTTLMGIIFGTAYVLNGRSIWPLIIVHGLLDALILLSFYYGVFQ